MLKPIPILILHNRVQFNSLILTAVPAVIFGLGVLMYSWRAPIFAGLEGFDYDPAYVYLFSGLSTALGVAPIHVDHPGTPLQLIIAVLLWVYWIGTQIFTSSSLSVSELVLTRPESLIFFISHTLLLMNTFAVFFLGRLVLRATSSILSAILVQTAPLLMGEHFFRIMYLNAEAVAIFATLLLIGILITELHSTKKKDGKNGLVYLPILAGGLVAIIITSKISFLPFLFSMFLMRSRKRILACGVAMLTITAVILLPIITRLSKFWDWLWRITEHDGAYGSGSKSVINMAAIPQRLKNLFELYPLGFFLLLTVFMGAGLFVYHNRHRFYRGHYREVVMAQEFRYITTVMIMATMQIAIVLKHYGAHYALGLVFIGMIAVFFCTPRITMQSQSKLSNSRSVLLIIMITVNVLWSSFFYSNEFKSFPDKQVARDKEVMQIARAIENFERPIIFNTYRVPEFGTALAFGFTYTDLDLRELVAAKSPEIVQEINMYNRWNKMFIYEGKGWEDAAFIEHVAQQNERPVLLLFAKGVQVPDMNVQKIMQTQGGVTLYQVKTSKTLPVEAIPLKSSPEN